jgi:hypothetical protein
MKKKVNVNREKISAEEIASQRNFKSLTRNYISLTNPFRKTSWRTKYILWVVIVSAALVCYILNQEGCG